MNAERQLLMQLEDLSRMDGADRNASTMAADSGDLRESLHLLETLEDLRIPAPSLDALWQGRSALLAAVGQPRHRFSPLPLTLFPKRLLHALPSAALAAVLVAMTAGAAAVTGVGTPRATVSEVLSALGLNDQAVRPVAPGPTSPSASPPASQENLTWPPQAVETSVPVGLPGQEETSENNGPRTPGASGENPGQGATNPGHGGENPGQGVGPDGSGTPPGQSGENPGQGVGPDGSGTPPGQSGENPGQGGGQGQENQGNGAPREQGGSNPGQGRGNGNGQGGKP